MSSAEISHWAFSNRRVASAHTDWEARASVAVVTGHVSLPENATEKGSVQRAFQPAILRSLNVLIAINAGITLAPDAARTAHGRAYTRVS